MTPSEYCMSWNKSGKIAAGWFHLSLKTKSKHWYRPSSAAKFIQRQGRLKQCIKRFRRMKKIVFDLIIQTVANVQTQEPLWNQLHTTLEPAAHPAIWFLEFFKNFHWRGIVNSTVSDERLTFNQIMVKVATWKRCDNGTSYTKVENSFTWLEWCFHQCFLKVSFH